MEKLIVVGMKYQDNEFALKQLRVGDRVTLFREKNDNGVNGIAYKCGTTNGPIGYVRNQDLTGLLKYVGNSGFQSISDLYKVDTIRQNYIVLTKSALSVNVDSETTRLAKEFFDKGPEAKVTAANSMNDIKKETNMNINTNSMRDQFFKEVKNVAIDIQSGKFGIKSAEGISVFTGEGINVNPIQEMGLSVPAFAMRISVDQLKAGDIVITNSDASFFVELTKTGYKTMSVKGVIDEVGTVSNMFFGKNSVLAVKNMFEGSGMNPMMMALMMGGDSNGSGKMDMKTLALMSMMGGMGGMGGEAGGMNPMMMMLLMADK